MLIAFAFASLGFLIGNMVGMTSSSVVSSLIPLLFAFGGGSAIAFIQKLEIDARKLASIAITCLSLSCLAGIYSGILMTEYHILSPENQNRTSQSREESTYLRAGTTSLVNFIDSQIAKGNITVAEGYEQLREGLLDLSKKTK